MICHDCVMSKFFLYISRIFFSVVFLVAGVGKLLNWKESVGYVVSTFSKWHMHFENVHWVGDLYEFLVSIAPILLGVAAFLEIVGALLLITGYCVRWGAIFLLIFLIPTTVFFHPFWIEIGGAVSAQRNAFIKNLALIGALLYMMIIPRKESASA